jgi:hemin uptake protein HemP
LLLNQPQKRALELADCHVPFPDGQAMTEKSQDGHQRLPRPEKAKPGNSGESYSSQELFRDAQEIAIEHQGASYRLRITRTGGLILNK